MRRWVFNFMVVVSLLLLVTTIVFAIRAQWGANDYVEGASTEPPPPTRPADSTPWVDPAWDMWRAQFDRWDRRRWIIHVRANSDAIYAFGRQPFYGYPKSVFDVHFYYWVLIPALAILPAVALMRIVKQLRVKPGHCPTCGYDLRATPERCPECGTAVTRPSREAAVL